MNDISIEQHGGWQQFISHLSQHADIDQIARDTGAFTRAREVKTPSDLLRLVMAYCTCGLSFRTTAAWAYDIGLADISDVALMKRIKYSKEFLSQLVSQVLRNRYNDAVCEASSAASINLADATYIKGTDKRHGDWRIHSCFNLNSMQFNRIEITDTHGAEDLRRFAYDKGSLILADRGYARAAQLYYLIDQECDYIIRAGTRSLALRDECGVPISLPDIVRNITDSTPRSVTVLVAMNKRHTKHTEQMLPARLVIVRKSDEDTEYTRKTVKEKARRNRRSVASEDSLLMAGYCVFVTSLSEETHDNADILQLYRLRWQIELAFKRLKSLMQIDEFRAKDATIVQVCLHASLLLALLTEDIAQAPMEHAQADTSQSERYLSCWRLHSIVLLHVKSAVIGIADCFQSLAGSMTAMWRNLCEPPRKRKLQGVVGLNALYCL